MNAQTISERLRLQTMRAIADLHGTLLRPLRTVEIYNNRHVRLDEAKLIEAELVACWKDGMLTKNLSGEHDMTAKGRDYLQANAGSTAPVATTTAADEIPVFVPKRRGRKPGSHNKAKNPDTQPGPVRHISLSGADKSVWDTPPINCAPPPPKDPNHIELTLADLEQRLMQHEQAADELRELIANLKEIFKVKP